MSYMIGRELKNMYPDIETEKGDIILEILDYSVPHPEYDGKKYRKPCQHGIQKRGNCRNLGASGGRTDGAYDGGDRRLQNSRKRED